ncbi:hypothetical protein GCM10011496_05180 [Polaromonas eurypsychrophila]|uniref:Uncharacterized protein n=1 Tax=Polaromonas eurypsychrophila TaxID=1614635 RepID=A0A916S736_9BURK|nr:hypothetical protein GCM10011496_05180 [Polaromonas eurypsychrophila]
MPGNAAEAAARGPIAPSAMRTKDPKGVFAKCPYWSTTSTLAGALVKRENPGQVALHIGYAGSACRVRTEPLRRRAFVGLRHLLPQRDAGTRIEACVVGMVPASNAAQSV